MGTGYVIFSSCVAMLTFAAPRVRNKVARQWVSLVLMAGAGYTAMRIYSVRARGRTDASLVTCDGGPLMRDGAREMHHRWKFPRCCCSSLQVFQAKTGYRISSYLLG